MLTLVNNNTGNSDSHHILALATLDDATQIGLFLFLVELPKVAKANTLHRQRCPKAVFFVVCDPSMNEL
jgi:hypothetical protein